MHKRNDLSLLDRIEFLYDLAFECGDLEFLKSALFNLKFDQLGIIYGNEAESWIELYQKTCLLTNKNVMLRQELLTGIERFVVTAIKKGLNLEELVGVIEAVGLFRDELPESIRDIIDDSVDEAICQISDISSQLDFNPDPSLQIWFLDTLEELTGCDVSSAREATNEKQAFYELCVYSSVYSKRKYSGYYGLSRTQKDSFDDHALNSLFTTLVQK